MDRIYLNRLGISIDSSEKVTSRFFRYLRNLIDNMFGQQYILELKLNQLKEKSVIF